MLEILQVWSGHFVGRQDCETLTLETADCNFCVHFTHQLFKKFFDTNHSGDPSKDTAYIMTIEGRAYPIDVHYLKRLVLCLSVCVD